MRFIIAVFVCFSCYTGITGQTEKNHFVDNEVKLKAIILARKDAKGNIIEDVKVFLPTDIPIICYVDLTIAKRVTVTLHFIAVKVRGVRPNKKIISSSYKTKKDEDQIDFEGRPDKRWVKGSYRIDITINGKLAGSKDFIVQNKRNK